MISPTSLICHLIRFSTTLVITLILIKKTLINIIFLRTTLIKQVTLVLTIIAEPMESSLLIIIIQVEVISV